MTTISHFSLMQIAMTSIATCKTKRIIWQKKLQESRRRASNFLPSMSILTINFQGFRVFWNTISSTYWNNKYILIFVSKLQIWTKRCPASMATFEMLVNGYWESQQATSGCRDNVFDTPEARWNSAAFTLYGKSIKISAGVIFNAHKSAGVQFSSS